MADERDPMEEDLLAEDDDPAHLKDRVSYWLWDLIKTWGPALLTVLVIRSVVAEPFRIPSGSMVPTLEIGDYILVNKFSYGLRLPFTKIKLIPRGDPQRGEIIVFQYPDDPSIDYIKRVVGIPGDTIKVKNNVVYINGERQEKTYQHRFDFVDGHCNVEGTKLFVETIGDKEHLILNSAGLPMPLANSGPFNVPEGAVFVMGDNRDNSSDSRRWGTVPIPNIKGKALAVWLSYDHCAGKSLGPLRVGRLRLDRFGTVLK